MAAPIPVWTGVVTEEGVLHLDAKALFKRYVWSLRNKPIQLVIKKLGRPKSRVQLGYLWGVVYPVIAEELGYKPHEIPEMTDAIHDVVMRELRGIREGHNPLNLRVSLKEQDHDWVRDYIDDVRHWALTKHGIVTPDAQKAEVA